VLFYIYFYFKSSLKEEFEMKLSSNKKYQLLLSFFVLAFIALGSMGGCSSSNGGGNNKEGCCVIGPDACLDNTNQAECDGLGGDLDKGVMCSDILECDDPLVDADLVMGGLLYDKWWVTAGVDEPEGTNPVYPTEENAMFSDPPRMGSQTFRCKECHGWDYFGVDGFYGPPSSHFTNIEGVLHFDDHFPQEIHDIIAFGIPGEMLAYEGLISDDDIWDLTKFIVDGLIDDMLIVDYSSPDNAVLPPFSQENGEVVYNDACAECHGIDGEGLEAFDTEEISIHEVAVENPPEFIHKARFGNPGTLMPSMIDLGFSTQDVKDVLAYSQLDLP
jgi:mono/diheme cytochrome c family protein